MAKQYTNHLLMVRPASFQFNLETAKSNAFQKKLSNLSSEKIQAKAMEEFDAYVAKLRENKIAVLVIQDTKFPEKPDAIFPNNWICMDKDGTVFLFPPARRTWLSG